MPLAWPTFHPRLGASVLLVATLISAGCPGSSSHTDVQVEATVETAPVHHQGDAADDACVWIHPSDPALSTVIIDDKQGGLLVYDLAGNELQWIDQTLPLNNVDLRYGFPLTGTYDGGTAHTAVALVAVGDEGSDALRFYKVNPTSRLLEPLGAQATGRRAPYGGCLYHSVVDDRFHAFLTYKSGWTEQWLLSDNGMGGVDAVKVRQFDVGSQVEGCVADDAMGVIYIGEEQVAIWRYDAEPDAGTQRIGIPRIGNFFPDVEGLAIYHATGTTGYLIASSQGDNSYRVFDRTFAVGQPNTYRGSFAIRGGLIDGTTDTDGIDVVSLPLGPAFPNGVFIAQDGRNTAPGTSGNQNFKLVPWERIARGFVPPLAMTTDHDPRAAVMAAPFTAQ